MSSACRRRAGWGVAVDPRFRRLGVYTRMLKWRAEHVPREVTLGFSQVEALDRANRRAQRMATALGDRLGMYLRVLHPWRAAEAQPRARLRSAGYAAVRLRGALRAKQMSAACGFEIRELGAFDERHDAFWQEAATAWDFIQVRNAEYMNWRWLHPRVGPFAVLVAIEGAAIVGYIVLRADGPRGHIPDLLVLPDRDDVARVLIDTAVRRLDADGVGAIECWMMDHHPYAAALRDAGFVRMRRRSEELTRKLGINSEVDPNELAFLAKPHPRLHATEGDSDLI